MKMTMLPGMMTGVLLWAAQGLAESVPLKPGEYQITAVTEAGGETAKPDTRSRCVKEEHLANPDAVFNYYVTNEFLPKPSNKVLNVSIHEGKVSYDIEGPHAMTRVEGIVSGTSFSVLRKATPIAGNGLVIAMRVEGKRTGDCRSK